MCAVNRDEKCVLPGDKLNEWLQIMKKADGLIFASPVYFSGVAGTMKSFMDRAFFVAGVNGGMFRHKVGAAVVAVRRTGGMPAFQELNNYIHYSEMVVATSNYWNVIHGRVAGDAEKDEEGNQIMRILGKNMAWLLKSLEHSKVPKPEAEKKILTSFVR
jgi:multimeric flavodoxin WrbA